MKNKNNELILILKIISFFIQRIDCLKLRKFDSTLSNSKKFSKINLREGEESVSLLFHSGYSSAW